MAVTGRFDRLEGLLQVANAHYEFTICTYPSGTSHSLCHKSKRKGVPQMASDSAAVTSYPL